MFKKWVPFIGAGVIAGLVGVTAGLGLAIWMFPTRESPALNLPQSFALLEEQKCWGCDPEYISFFVGDPEHVRGEIAVPPSSHKSGVMTQVFYTALNGSKLMRADLSAADGGHQLQIFNWDGVATANVHIEDRGAQAIRITDAAGNLLAQGSRDADSGAFIVNSPDGRLLATISPAADGTWSVSVERYSRVANVIYALIAGYQTVVTTGKAVSI
ncbi:MAG: hypothetical protein EKK48_02735 [Candidatus Melainabacteria bacterium]|nr:MAG: hypothetical protein EKK48_02735 [Candidatus Melainabacteria bacterium]